MNGSRTGHSTGETRITTAPIIGIVDDDEPVRDSLSSLIRSVGYRTVVFASAEAFLNSDRRHEPACLILDIRMPGMSGLELQRQLSDMKWSIPIIFLTAHGDDELRTRALRQGASAFLLKPFADEALLDAIRSALGSSGALV
jgi:FixJ family two-component response regulator